VGVGGGVGAPAGGGVRSAPQIQSSSKGQSLFTHLILPSVSRQTKSPSQSEL
jgi:hypothetical protein